METIKKYLNYIGLTLVVLALITQWIWPYRKTLAIVMSVLGIAAIAIYVILNLSSLKRGFSRKSFLYSSNLLFVVVLVLGILILVNYFLARHHYRVDFTDPDKNPSLVKAYNITTDGTSILTSGDKENRITSATEEDITNAIIKVTREKKKTIYFLEGHGEGSIEESGDDGYSFAKDELGKMGYEVKKISLALSESFPQDCSLLVVPGPKKDLLPNELDTISRYLKGGGRVFFMVDPETAPGLPPFFAGLGFKLA